ncbi:Methyltransferase type 11 [Cystobacter fuscus DSM 2262]|uniref:Methyltransferase type 11 n=1 Tax=Cystobacter fuscus (strain ATCC 25194 / DSM 2262 / NBRC 100088 / M29) TaxID=1242864 RepID=S9PNZ9_CYSF2|nr:methyltransferase domain-containing protein [Cystobacter fuscus]EPX64187.1 Methyltransferase type 11 [Cystobacter fuscus DSM 2262]
MNATSTIFSDFHDLDQATASKEAVRFLDALNTSQQVQEMQQLTHLMLGVAPGQRILDAGCGVGDVTRDLATLVGPRGHVVGVDLSEALLAEAHARTRGTGLSVEYRKGDLHSLDFPSESFDRCRSSRVFIYLDDPRKALSELLRLTRPGGAVVIFEPEFDTWALDGPDRGVVRALIHFWTDQLRNPWIGRQLPRMFHSLGVNQVTMRPVVGTWVPRMLETFGMYPVLEKAIAEKVVTREQVDTWLQFLEEGERNDSFYGCMAGMVVRGIKPGP